MALNADDLKRLSALLDQALGLEPPALESWLQSLDADSAALAPQLRALLSGARSVETGDLLDRGPALTGPAVQGDQADFDSGDRIGPYRLMHLLGRGGMGEVWLAQRADGLLKRPVALKLPMLGMRHAVLVQRFARERDILGALAHPHIARLYDAGLADDGQPYLALEYVEGQPITAYCETHALPTRERVRLLLQVMDAVQHAHANLVIHRDLKPANVLVTAEGRAMLLDFGIAKLLRDDDGPVAETELTRVGGRAMTLDYAAPEQINGAPVSIAVDVWALGALAFELIVGQRPFSRASRLATERAVLGEEPAWPTGKTGLARGLGAELRTIVLKALKKLPGDRYPTVNAFADDLRRWLAGQPVLARADSAWYVAGKFVQRNKPAVAVAAAVTAVVLGATAVSIYQAQRAQAQTLVAQTEARTAEEVQKFLEDIFKANTGDQSDPIRARQRTARELIDDASVRIDKALADAPEAKLRLLFVLALMYGHMGEAERQIELLRAAVAHAEKAFPGPSAERADALTSLASALRPNGRAREARQALREAQDILDRNPAVDADRRRKIEFTVLNDHAQRDDAAGLAVADRLLAALRHEPPKGFALVGLVYMRGILLRHAGALDASLQSLEEALAMVNREPGAAAAGRATIHQEIANTQAARGDFVAAERSQREAIEEARRNMGPSSERVISLTSSLARLLSDIGRSREALELLGGLPQLVAQLPDNRVRTSATHYVTLIELAVKTRVGQPGPALRAWQLAVSGSMGVADDPRLQANAAFAEARAFRDLGRLREADSAIATAERLVDEHSLGGRARSRLELERVERALRQRDLAAAQAAWQRLKALPAPVSPWLAVTQAEIESAARGPVAAGVLASQLLTEFDKAPAALEQGYARERLWVLASRGRLVADRPAEALAALDQALVLNASLADIEVSPLRMQALGLRAQAELALGSRADALASLAQARAIRARHAGLNPAYTEPVDAAAAMLASR